jgi:hypothetical protein
MPRLDGMATLEYLRDAGVEARVVIVTMHGGIPDAVAAMKLDGIGFLAKLLTPDALRRVVAEVIQRYADQEPESTRPDGAAEVVTIAGQYAVDLARAKWALNNRWFEEAEVFLKQALALRPDLPETHNLMGVLHEMRHEHDASGREYRAALKADRHSEPAQHNKLRHYDRFTFGTGAVPIDLGDADARS